MLIIGAHMRTYVLKYKKVYTDIILAQSPFQLSTQISLKIYNVHSMGFNSQI